MPVLNVENPHFIIRLYENLLGIDLKGSFKNEVEEALENKLILKKNNRRDIRHICSITHTLKRRRLCAYG